MKDEKLKAFVTVMGLMNVVNYKEDFKQGFNPTMMLAYLATGNLLEQTICKIFTEWFTNEEVIAIWERYHLIISLSHMLADVEGAMNFIFKKV